MIESLGHPTDPIGRLYNVSDMRVNTCSMKVDWFTRLLYRGLDLHVEHRMFPAVPSYNLPKLHAPSKDEPPSAFNVIGRWRQIFAMAP